MKRALIVAAVCAVLFILFGRNLRIEDDMISSLRDNDPRLAELFQISQEQSLFRGKIFVDVTALPQADEEALSEFIKSFRYEPSSISSPETSTPATRAAALAMLSPQQVQEALSVDALDKTTNEAISSALLPGGSMFLETISADPFGFQALALKDLQKALPKGQETNSRILVFKSPSPLNFGDVGEIYGRLKELAPKVHFVGADFFAYENYEAMRRDIMICMIVSIPLNLLLFFLFYRKISFVVFLLAGSAVSYLTGISLVRLFYQDVYAVVLAFTSTFIGFNNEYLVHLCGLDGKHVKARMVGLWSAIGTTLIGFVVLLFGQSPIIKQMALVSIGGMVGFLAFLWLYRDRLSKIRIRPLVWKTYPIGRIGLSLAWIASLAAILWTGLPGVRNDIEDFRLHLPTLDQEAAYFANKAPGLTGAHRFALSCPGRSLDACWRMVFTKTHGALLFHPLQLLRSETEQTEVRKIIRNDYHSAADVLSKKLVAQGFKITIPLSIPAEFATPLSSEKFLQQAEALTGAKFHARIGNDEFLLLQAKDEAAENVKSQAEAESWVYYPLGPKPHYDSILTGLSKQMAVLFLAGLLAMVVYLIVMQRSAIRVVYIMTPLVLGFVMMLVWLHLHHHAAFNIVHLMGWALVIAIAIDYAAIAVSSNFSATEMTNVLITGLSSIASFAALLLASHPVLRDLGLTVTIGSAVALAFSLWLRLKTPGGP